jgi:tRNA(Ile)-lysidine synthase
MLKKIQAYIEENNMLKRKDKIVIGVSGGADSVCLFFVLLKLLKEYELTLFLVHINHGIRGAKADEDEAFVRELALEHGVSYRGFRADIPTMAKERGCGLEEAGRLYRYEVLKQVKKEVEADKIAVAHNENDCAETVLLNLFRGARLYGLCGILPVREDIIRPLLCVSRKEIETWLFKEGISYRTDETNFSDEYTRNRVRLRLLPMAEKEINEKAVSHTAKTAAYLREVSAYLEKQTKEAYLRNVTEKNGVYFLRNDLMLEDKVLLKGVIKKTMEEAFQSRRDLTGCHVAMVEELFSKQVGKTVHLPYGGKAVREYEGIRLLRKKVQIEEAKGEKGKEQIDVSFLGEYNLADGRKICFKVREKSEKFIKIPKNDCTKWFDYDRIKGNLFLRHREAGDYLQIREDGGRKKLKDELIDKKIPREERDSLWLLAEDSHILWILGGRASKAYPVTDKTERILEVKCEKSH